MRVSTPLPGWVIDDAESVRREAAPYVDLMPEQRAADLKAVCLAAAKMLRARQDAVLILDYRDPLPQSTLDALTRLRRQARRKQHD